MTPGTYIASSRGIRPLKGLSLTDGAAWHELFGTEDARRLTLSGAYARQGWLRRCVKVRAGALADLPWSVRRVAQRRAEPLWRNGEPAPAEFHPVRALPFHLFLIGAAVALEHRAYALKEREAGRLSGLYWFNPCTVTAEQDAGGIFRYKRQVNRGYEYYAPEDLVAIHAPDPYVEVGPGASDGQAALTHATVLDSLASFLNGHIQGGLVKATVIRVPASTPPEERGRIERFWNRWILGRKNASRVKVVSTEVHPEAIGEGLKDLQNVQLTREQREAIATALGVPHGLVDSSSIGAKATIQEDHVLLYTQTVLPDAELIQHALNEQLFGPMGYAFRFEPHRLELFQAREVAKADALQKLTGRPVLTVNEARERMELDPVPGGDALYVPGQAVIQVRPDQAEDVRKHLRERELAALRRVFRKHGPTRPFAPEHLDPAEVEVIRERLLAGQSVEEAFERPFEAGAG